MLDGEMRMECVSGSMDSIMRFAGDDDLELVPQLDCRGDVLAFNDGCRVLARVLMLAAVGMERCWNGIVVNEMCIERARRFVGAVRGFHEKAYLFDSFFSAHGDLLLEWFDDAWAGRTLYVGLTRYVRVHSFLFDRIERDGKGGAVTHAADGAAARFKRYFVGVREADVIALFRDGSPLPGRPRWIGKRCEAVVFGRMLGLNCCQMNRCFVFFDRNGSPRVLSYQNDEPKMDGRFYDIYALVSRQKQLMEMEGNLQ